MNALENLVRRVGGVGFDWIAGFVATARVLGNPDERRAFIGQIGRLPALWSDVRQLIADLRHGTPLVVTHPSDRPLIRTVSYGLGGTVTYVTARAGISREIRDEHWRAVRMQYEPFEQLLVFLERVHAVLITVGVPLLVAGWSLASTGTWWRALLWGVGLSLVGSVLFNVVGRRVVRNRLRALMR